MVNAANPGPRVMPPVQGAYTEGDPYGTNNTVATGGPNDVNSIRGKQYALFMDREEQVNAARQYMRTRGLPMTQKNLLTTMAWLSGEDVATDAPSGVDAAMATVDAGDAGMASAAGEPEKPSSPIPQPRPDAAVDQTAVAPEDEGLPSAGLPVGVLAGARLASWLAARLKKGELQLDAKGNAIDPVTGEVMAPAEEVRRATSGAIEGPVIDGTATDVTPQATTPNAAIAPPSDTPQLPPPPDAPAVGVSPDVPPQLPPTTGATIDIGAGGTGNPPLSGSYEEQIAELMRRLGRAH